MGSSVSSHQSFDAEPALLFVSVIGRFFIERLINTTDDDG